MLALSAGSPIYRGFLADVDCRWNVIAQSVDDRTEEELGQIPLANNKFVINKSRYDSIDCFISPGPFFKHAYNDLRLVKDDLVYNRLVTEGVDDLLAQHVAHLFIRDPLVVYKESLHQDNEAQSEHFENIQSTNWQTVRFKPPPPGSSIGWRVEFRPMEVQMSDFENAAYVVFVVLLTRVFLSFNLNLYLPISLIDENIQNAQKRDAVNSGLFHFRTILTAGSCGKETELMTLDKIINGEGDFLGLVPLIFIFLDSITIDLHTRFRILQYLSLISKRAKGELLTTAAYLRKFVTEHPDYKHDSVVSERINYDLVKMAVSVGEGEIIPELVGDCYKKNMCFKESREQK
jgi:glutamate--cysteine ligase catalytic subunit